jgi:4-amino-4-deoxy-L-arabinose transferase-like glycosyltransferase
MLRKRDIVSIQELFKDKYTQILLVIFLLALILRFLYFPHNIYFGFDQARDAYVVGEILLGNLKVLGPSTSIEGLYHGSLYYYIFAPFYAISSGDPIGVAAVLRILNALGVFIVFWIAKILFNKKTALISAFFYAISFEQTQFAIYINHPSLSIISLLFYYLGWVQYIFQQKKTGFALMLAGLGFSLQFEFVMVYLILTSIILGALHYKTILKLGIKWWILGWVVFIIPLSTYILAEIKYNFRSLQVLPSLLNSNSEDSVMIIRQLWFIIQRFFTYNIYALDGFISLTIIVFVIVILYFFKTNTRRHALLFLLIWFISGLFNYMHSYSSIPILHYGAGASIGLLIFMGFLIGKVLEKNLIFACALVIIPLISNLFLITTLNSKGSLPEVNVQSGMLLSDQKNAINYMYSKSQNEPFSINSLSMPLHVNTTWSYLLENYGNHKFGSIPVWGGNAAAGYPGNIKVEVARSKLPQMRFLIIEPTRGIHQYLIDDFIREENYFTKVVETKYFGAIKVETREVY